MAIAVQIEHASEGVWALPPADMVLLALSSSVHVESGGNAAVDVNIAKDTTRQNDADLK